MFNKNIKTEIIGTPFKGENNKFHYIYKIYNLNDGREYTGLRTSDKVYDGYCGSGTYITDSIKKHGIENFKKVITEFFQTREELSDKENEIVNEEYVKRNDTYNLRGGGLQHGIYISDDIATKISQNKKGWIPSEETRKRMSESAKIRKSSEEDKLKRSIKMKEEYASGKRTAYWTNKVQSRESNEKRSKTLTGIKRSEETRSKMSKFQSHRSREYQDKINRGKWKKVLCVETNEIFDSAQAASLKYSKNDKAVSFAIRNNIRFPRKMYHWKYIE